jgi:hypothetical protein
MEIMTKEEFAELAKQPVAKPCITICIPTHSSGVEVNEKYDLITFKNLLQDITRQLENEGMSGQEIDALLKAAYDLLEEELFWLNLSEGLAVFIAKDFFKVIKVPMALKEELHINSVFHLSPLIPFLSNPDHFYLLVFSKSSSSLFKGDMFGMEHIEVEGLPQGVNDVIHFEEKDDRKLFRTGGTSPGAKASYHGHGSGLADEKEYISQYLTELDQTLHTEVLANERVPLVLAAVEYMIGIYRQVSGYRNIADVSITGNYDHTDTNTLFEKALEIVKPYFKERSSKALQNYYNQILTPLTSSMPEKVIPASFYKQISDLFVEKDIHIWGTFDESTNKLTIHDEKQEGDECLVNRAIVNTLLNGGDVHILDPERMPKEAKIAAFMRF